MSHNYGDADPCHFDVNYLVFNMKFHRQIVTHRLVCCFTQSVVVVWANYHCLHSQQMSVTYHYTICVKLYINILITSPHESRWDAVYNVVCFVVTMILFQQITVTVTTVTCSAPPTIRPMAHSKVHTVFQARSQDLVSRGANICSGGPLGVGPSPPLEVGPLPYP